MKVGAGLEILVIAVFMTVVAGMRSYDENNADRSDAEPIQQEGLADTHRPAARNGSLLAIGNGRRVLESIEEDLQETDAESDAAEETDNIEKLLSGIRKAMERATNLMNKIDAIEIVSDDEIVERIENPVEETTAKPLENVKINLFCAFSKMKMKESYGLCTVSFYKAIFECCRHQRMDPSLAFTPEEGESLRIELPSVLRRAYPAYTSFCHSLVPGAYHDMLIARSALQFLHDDFDEYLDDVSRMYMVEPEYDDLEEQIESCCMWELFSSALPDLKGVPESHQWWTQYHREGRENPSVHNADKAMMPWYIDKADFCDGQ